MSLVRTSIPVPGEVLRREVVRHQESLVWIRNRIKEYVLDLALLSEQELELELRIEEYEEALHTLNPGEDE